MTPQDVMSICKRIVKPVAKRVKLAVSKAVLDAITDSTGLQTHKLQLLADEVLDNLERFQEYGFTSVPLSGAEGIAVFVGGNRGNGALIATDDRRYRLKNLGPGDVALYTDQGDFIKLSSSDRKIEMVTEEEWSLTTKAVNLSCETATVTASGDVSVSSDNATITASTKAVVDSPAVEIGSGTLEAVLKGETFQTFFNSHTHVGNAGAPTSPPQTPSDPSHLSTVVKEA